MSLTPAQRDRALAVLLATAAGDALGAGYEFGPPLDSKTEVLMKGGGSFDWKPGEWTDDTSMAVAIAKVAATGADLRGEDGQDRLVSRWMEWSQQAKDVGIQTGRVLGDRAVVCAAQGGRAVAARGVAAELHAKTGKTAGNGSLMRTAPLAIAYLDDPEGLNEAAGAVAKLTHWDGLNVEACVLWCQAIRHAVLTGNLDARVGLPYLDADRRAEWVAWLAEAERSLPRDFPNNGFVVAAMQAAWSAIKTTPVPADNPGDHLRLALENAVRGGRDTDTVAAIAGGLLGAAYGVTAVPSDWQSLLTGWPGMDAGDLIALAREIIDHRS